jgi:L-asparaginase
MARARIAIIGAGGTIAMEGANPFDWLDYGDTGIVHGVEAILARLDLGLPDVELVPHSFRTLASTGIGPADWHELAAAIDALMISEPPLSGVVVTHGTASMEETAFFLHLVHRHAAPVALVGAQRPANTASSDAVANLRAAVIAAGDSRLRAMGVFVVMNSALHTAPSVAKVANHDLEAFASPEFGPLGRIDPDGGLWLARRMEARTLPILPLPNSAGDLPRVDVVFSYAGADGVAVDGFVAAGARALVLAGFPPGRSTPGERDAARRAVKNGVVVVQSSRALVGRTPRQRYNSLDGILSGGGLSPQKARILIMLGLAAGLSAEALQELLLSF